VPASIPLTEASTLGCAGIVSLWGIKHAAGVKPGQRVFVNGGSSGTGLFAVQFAKALGAYVVATGSGQSGELLTKLGVDEVVDYRKVGPLAQYLGKTYGSKETQFDVVHDCIGVSELFFGCKACT
jgi:NADPH:quinone reductase-like Zn-dependent oxidoreductase